ncbi:MAG: MFS transporter, partial [Acidobacteria bacterium]|nr:MFS transporter [Acidobacteriota bacterium]
MNAMEPKTARDPEAAGSRERTLLLLLMVSSVVFNYVDRSALSVAAPALASDLALGPRQMGVLLSAFFWSYAGTMAIAGWLVDRYHTTWVFVAGFLVWSLATLATGMAGGMQSLLVFRLLLGWGQSISFPAYSRFIVSGFPAERRALPNALIDAGAKLGPAVATLIGGNLIAAYGWRSLFFILGGASLISLGPWCVWPPRVPAQPPSGKDAPSILAILRRREAWGTFFGNSAQSYGFFFLFTWFPTYLVRERGLSLRRMALFGSTPFAASALASVTAGWASDHLIRRGFSPTRVRKTVVVTGILGTILLIPAAAAESLGVCMAL